jgi:hypothetical protein
MQMKTFLLGLIIVMMNFSAMECDAQTSRLPKEMPEKTEIRFSNNGGMLNAYTKILIANQTISVEEKKGNQQNPQKWTAKIEKTEQENLYQIFVENKFDTIKNDERKGIVYDAGSESVFLNLGNGKSYGVTYSKNSPLSGSNLRRYQIIAKAIQDLRAQYESKAQKIDDSGFAVFGYAAGEHSWIFKKGQAVTLTAIEIAEVKKLLQKAVDEYNSGQNNNDGLIKLDEYKFQFVAVLSEKGEKEVWINSFCTDFEDWREQIVQVDDGGKCFFNLHVNLTKKSFDRLSVNGVA